MLQSPEWGTGRHSPGAVGPRKTRGTSSSRGPSSPTCKKGSGSLHLLKAQTGPGSPRPTRLKDSVLEGRLPTHACPCPPALSMVQGGDFRLQVGRRGSWHSWAVEELGPSPAHGFPVCTLRPVPSPHRAAERSTRQGILENPEPDTGPRAGAG